MKLSSTQQIFGIDLRTLAFFRICLACLLLGDLADRAIDLSAHYSDSGIVPRVLLLDIGGWRPSLHLISGSVVVQGALFALAALCASALLVGYRTRIATAACWFLTLSLQVRNPYIMSGGDALILVLLFWSMFLPLGARFSVDAALTPQDSKNRYFSIATLALLFQCMYVYFFGALLKTGDTWLADGTALAYALRVDSYATVFGQWFLQRPSLTQLMTYFVWYLELLAPFFMFLPLLHVPFRSIALISLIILHLGFFVFLKVGIFPFASLTSLMVFIPGEFWDWLTRHLRRKKSVTIYYDEHCDFCRKMCLLLRTFLILNQAKIEPAQSDLEIGATLERENSWVVVDADGTQYLRWDAMILLFRRSPLFAPLAAIMRLRLLSRLGSRCYLWVARNRELLGRFSQRWLSYSSPTLKLSRPSAVVVGLLFVCVLYLNIIQTPAFPYKWPNVVSPITDTLALHQYWNMFAPDPPKTDHWFVAIGELASGERVDLLRDQPYADYQKPEEFQNFFTRDRWKLYYWRVLEEAPKVPAHLFARYLCDRWDTRQPSGREVIRIELGYVLETTPGVDADTPDQRITLIDEKCRILRIRPRLRPVPL